ncbi:hypothetical protein GCM10009775_10070 [Microbacterium aoyamense]|uniref:NodB homology domain-containing protein n=1 Tax=Microbacterium aoyamense TaxID=344166 RepID=A0ABP5AS36_9MICO|nr:polysaccharide deacetylase family protein [Microbacterium aoyamense]
MQIRFGLDIKRRLTAVQRRAAGAVGGRIAAGRMVVERHALASAGTDMRRSGGRILCYHSLAQPRVWGVNDLTPNRFRQQLESALDAGYRFVPASEIVRTGGGPLDLSVTFDDGARSVLTEAAPILAALDIPFSLFVVSEWSEHGHKDSVLNWDEVSRVAELGGEIGNHSSTHPDFARLDKQQSLDEIGGAQVLIERRTGIRTSTFAIPLGKSTNWNPAADDAARELGYGVVYAQSEEMRPADTVPRSFVTRYDSPRVFDALLRGRYDAWEEWVAPVAR